MKTPVISPPMAPHGPKDSRSIQALRTNSRVAPRRQRRVAPDKSSAASGGRFAGRGRAGAGDRGGVAAARREKDDNINKDIAYEAALSANSRKHAVYVHPGMQHAYDDDTGAHGEAASVAMAGLSDAMSGPAPHWRPRSGCAGHSLRPICSMSIRTGLSVRSSGQ